MNLLFQYFEQLIGHCQHGMGEFHFISDKVHEMNRFQYENIEKKFWYCGCENCIKNRPYKDYEGYLLWVKDHSAPATS